MIHFPGRGATGSKKTKPRADAPIKPTMEPDAPPRVAKVKNPPPVTAAAAPAGDGPPAYKSNPEVDARIDAYIKDNPKHWSYVQGMSRERLERSVVLAEVRQLERQQRMREGIVKKIDRDPQLKQAYDTLVKDLPEDQREAVIAQLARTRQRVAPSPQDSTKAVRV